MAEEKQYVSHRYIVENTVEYRSYQVKAASSSIKNNTLVVLPTGTGKTIIAILASAYWLERHPNAKVIMVAPTRPLVDQHLNLFRKSLRINWDKICGLTGETPPSKRASLWSKQVIIATPQVVYNDIVKGFVPVKDDWLIIFDEAHRAVKEHPYAKIARLVNISRRPRIIGLTASPGDLNKTKEIMANLQIRNLILLTRRDIELRRYLQPIKWNVVEINPPPQLRYALELVRDVINRKIDRLNDYVSKYSKELTINFRKLSYTVLDNLRSRIEEFFIADVIPGRVRNELNILINQLIMLDKLLSYLESYSYKLFNQYYERIRAKALRGSIPSKMLMGDPKLNEAYMIIKEMEKNNYLYPKMEELIRLLKASTGKTIVFTSIKSVALEICDVLNHNSIKALYLVGQTKSRKDVGMRQSEQVSVIRRFSSSDYNVLVATHVGEEGLDISEVKNVIFYDNPISAVRRIQREGRTGRSRPGNIHFLITRGTRDESRYWAGVSKEKRLYDELKSLKPELIDMDEKVKPLTEYIDNYGDKHDIKLGLGIEIVVDYRERSGDIVSYLKENGFNVRLDNLMAGDYLIGNYLVERKTMDDFATSIVDGRIFRQLKLLKDAGGHPIIIIEGNIVEFTKKLDLNVYTGTVLTIIDDFKVPVIITSSSKETADFIASIAKRVSKAGDKYVKLRFERKPLDIKDIQRYVLAGIPGINNVLADKLLKAFGSIERIACADYRELMKVEGIGQQLAKRIYEVFHSKYHS